MFVEAPPLENLCNGVSLELQIHVYIYTVYVCINFCSPDFWTINTIKKKQEHVVKQNLSRSKAAKVDS